MYLCGWESFPLLLYKMIRTLVRIREIKYILEMGEISLRQVAYLVLDMGFEPQLRKKCETSAT